MSDIIVDISELIRNPVRSGVQRVICNLIAAWHDNPAIIWGCYDRSRGSLVYVPKRVLSILELSLFRGNSASTEVSLRIQSEFSFARTINIQISHGQKILVPEIMFDVDRIHMYRRMRDHYEIVDFFIVFDFMPWLNPSIFSLSKGFGAASMPYLDVLQGAASRIFISHSTYEVYSTRIQRRGSQSDGVVLSLGADGIPVPKQVFSRSRRIILCLGAFDGKKGQELVFNGFLEAKIDLELHFVGRVPDRPDPKFSSMLSDSFSNVIVHGDVSDERLASLISNVRGSIFISENEGFGLPALESLWLGIPVVVHRSLPALKNLSNAGQIRLSSVDPHVVASSLRALADDVVCRDLWEETSRLTLQSWGNFSEECLAYLRAFY